MRRKTLSQRRSVGVSVRVNSFRDSFSITTHTCVQHYSVLTTFGSATTAYFNVHHFPILCMYLNLNFNGAKWVLRLLVSLPRKIVVIIFTTSLFLCIHVRIQ